MIKVLKSENDELRKRAPEDAKLLEATKKSSDESIARMSKELDDLLKEIEERLSGPV